MRKFYEALPFGRKTNLVAFTLDPDKLPKPIPGAEWKEDTSFREQEVLSNDPSFKRILDAARKNGFATLERSI